jgi:hypothetical protein
MDITVFFYNEHEFSKLYHSQLSNVPVKDKRATIPSSFRAGKVIVAVVEGHVNVLNTLGERLGPEASSDIPDTLRSLREK